MRSREELIAELAALKQAEEKARRKVKAWRVALEPEERQIVTEYETEQAVIAVQTAGEQIGQILRSFQHAVGQVYHPIEVQARMLAEGESCEPEKS